MEKRTIPMSTDLTTYDPMSKVLPNKQCSQRGNRVRLTLIFMIVLATVSFPAFVLASGDPSIPRPSGPSDLLFTVDPSSSNPSDTPMCSLEPAITGVHLQDNSAWCWAASTHLVITYLEPASSLKQCEVVYNTLVSTGAVHQYEQTHPGVHIDCCRVTDAALVSENASDPVIIGSKIVCHTTFRPEGALRANGYVTAGGQDRFQIVWWDPNSTIPEGVPWPDLTAQICMNRPFISVKLWEGGGTHSEVVTGYRLNPDAWVEIESHNLDGVHTIPYNDYLRMPGQWVGRVRDYYDIGL